MKYATDCKEVVIRNSELIAKSDQIQQKHDRLKQPIKFYESMESVRMHEPIEFFEN